MTMISRTLIAGVFTAFLCAFGCKKKQQQQTQEPEPMPQHVDRLIGTKVWHFIYTDARPTPPYHTSYIKPDVTLTIDYVDKERVRISSDTLVSYTRYNTDTTIGYTKFGNGSSPNVFPMHELIFNHVTGRIQYKYTWHVSAGAGEANNFYYTP